MLSLEIQSDPLRMQEIANHSVKEFTHYNPEFLPAVRAAFIEQAKKLREEGDPSAVVIRTAEFGNYAKLRSVGYELTFNSRYPGALSRVDLEVGEYGTWNSLLINDRERLICSPYDLSKEIAEAVEEARRGHIEDNTKYPMYPDSTVEYWWGNREHPHTLTSRIF